MATKTLELDISGNIEPIFFVEEYERYRLLIRSQKHPLGWIDFSRDGEKISSLKIQKLIKSQLGSLEHQALTRKFAPAENENYIKEGISVIVCTRNRTSQLATCLQSLLSLSYPLFEIIIVDNAPSNNDTKELTANLPVRYVREEKPGLDRARNKGIAEAQYEIVAFTDDDTKVDAFWLDSIARTFANKNVMGGSGYVAPAELETEAQHLFELGFGGMGHGFYRRHIQKEKMDDKQLLWASSFGIGANMAFRKKVFQHIGLFDTALDVGTPSHGGGDVEIFHRLVTNGHLFVYEPSMLIWHYHRREEKALRRQIFDNGRSFGCYLINCYRKKTVNRNAILQFFLHEWFYKWNLKNLVKKNKIPRKYALAELYGMLTSPFAYWQTKKWDQEMNRQ